MSQKPEIALLVSTFERPQHLRRVLLSISLQRHVEGKFEVVVTDDGSQDETAEIVAGFSRRVDFPVYLTTHPHDGFRLAQCRNEGVARTKAPYLVFVDGDCLLPPDYVYQHYRQRQPGVVRSGDCCRLDRETTERIDEEVIRRGVFVKWAPRAELRRLARERRKAWFYSLVGKRSRPKLFAGTAAMWREDYCRVNGYDENFQGWGCEDDDIRLRLTQSGVRVKSILFCTCSYHLWHPTVPSFPKTWRQGNNVSYLTRGLRLSRCRNGLKKLSDSDRHVRIVGTPAHSDVVSRLLPQISLRSTFTARPEIEILVLPGSGRFSGQAECNILILLEGAAAPRKLIEQAHVLLGEQHLPELAGKKCVPVDEFQNVLRAVA